MTRPAAASGNSLKTSRVGGAGRIGLGHLPWAGHNHQCPLRRDGALRLRPRAPARV